LFDPDGTRDETVFDANGDPVVKTLFEFSEDGGGTWKVATGNSLGVETGRLGRQGTFLWKAPANAAISDNMLFRITLIPQSQTGPVQRGATSAVSPPFRVRGVTCQWPDDASIIVQPANPKPEEKAIFIGNVKKGSGVVTFIWDFGDTFTATGQVIQHSYPTNNTYTVTLTVRGEACPIAGKDSEVRLVKVGTGVPNIYLPLVLKNGSGTPPTVTGSETPILTIQTIPDAPSQVTGLAGSSQLGVGTTTLTWQANPSEEGVLSYRVYRTNIADATFRLLAELPAEATTYTDNTAACSQMYLITALNGVGESLPSTASYFSLPCP
jgi:hypothetical protein